MIRVFLHIYTIVSKAGSPVVPALDPIRWLREALPVLTFCQLLPVVGPMVLPTELGAPLPPVINHAGTEVWKYTVLPGLLRLCACSVSNFVIIQ